MKYNVTLNSGVCLEVTLDDERDVTGLWIWMCRQYQPQFLNFNECTIKASNVALMAVVNDNKEANHE